MKVILPSPVQKVVGILNLKCGSEVLPKSPLFLLAASLLGLAGAVFLHQAMDYSVVRRGRGLLQKPPKERHEVRIVLKNIRYTAEFFSSFFAAGVAAQRRAARYRNELGIQVARDRMVGSASNLPVSTQLAGGAYLPPAVTQQLPASLDAWRKTEGAGSTSLQWM